MIKAVIFDMDGVLIDTEKYLVKYWVQAGQEFGFDMRREYGLLIRSLAGKYAQPLLRELFGPEFDYFKVRQRRKELMEAQINLTGIEKKPFVDKALSELREMGIKAAVATATDEERAGRYLRQIGIYDMFDKVICVNMVENGKPQPDIYLYACDQIGETPQTCVAVEDSPNGVLSAVRAGLRTIMVPDLTEPEADIKEIIYARADHLGQIPEIVAGINACDR